MTFTFIERLATTLDTGSAVSFSSRSDALEYLLKVFAKLSDEGKAEVMTAAENMALLEGVDFTSCSDSQKPAHRLPQ